MSHSANVYICPNCRAPISTSRDDVLCAGCSRTYERRDDIYVFVDWRAPQKIKQATFFDTPDDPDWEMQRPFGAPRLHSHAIQQKVERGVASLGTLEHGASALVVCGGSGMDAQFLAERGFRVVTSDISLGACRRAVERSRRFGFPLTAVVADAERLPFKDGSFDLVYVHDGLHHLEQPYAALDEMLRVARRAVSVNEPAAAAATRAAAWFGVAEAVEEAGNRVNRLSLDDIRGRCAAGGFDVVAAERYAMFYRHKPGLPMRVFSKRGLFEAARAGSAFANAVVGRLGNKLTVQAVRHG